MKKLFLAVVTLSFVLMSTFAQAWSPDSSDKMELSVAQAIITAKDKDPSLAKWFEEAYGYAVFPKVGKGGIGIGGAHGKGLVIHGDTTMANTSLSQLTIGFQLGGQAYSQVVFFKDKRAFEEFTTGQFEFSAQAEAIAITYSAGAQAGTDGASASANANQSDTNYYKGLIVFTMGKGGLMYQAALGGQKYDYKASK